jgi:Zn-finger nucleic acid-binding protein
MNCSACGAEIAVANVFPGGAVTCACGAKNRVSVSQPAKAVSSAPYREADVVTSPPAPLTCPFCGGETASDARACPHCDVHLSNVRCPTCFALQATGERTCARCGRELDLEPLFDPTDAPCPRCDAHLKILPGGGGMHECETCGGLFLDHTTLAGIMREREQGGPLAVPGARPFELQRSGGRPEADVHYVKCPMCHERMNRVNFGKKSGVVVDVCRSHGTWFDAGELTRAVEWVASGGMRVAAEARKLDEARVTRAQAEAQVAMMTEAMRETERYGRHVAMTRTLVDVVIDTLLWW